MITLYKKVKKESEVKERKRGGGKEI